MGIFAPRAGSAPSIRPEARAAELTQTQLAALPPEFEAVGEALASGSGVADAYAVLGHRLAVDGISLDEALSGLDTTFRMVLGTSPAFADARALSVAWSESILGYLHRLSCEDPATGLATMAHVQSRLGELYRAEASAGHVAESHTLVVVELGPPGPGDEVGAEVLTEDLRVARAAEAIRTTFAGHEITARLARHRLTVLAPRDDRLGQRVALLRRLLTPTGPEAVRVWIEGLPRTRDAAAATLAELARL
jgi:hypothetical protein